ncbi:DNA-methyltransferase, partial [Candidatus Hydrogenedentota bacterium]
DMDLEILGFSDTELRLLLDGDTEDEDELPTLEEGTKTQPGDLIVLGNHRIFCGSSTIEPVIKAVMEGHKAKHVFAGPPCFNQRGLGNWESYSAYTEDMRSIIRNCASVLRKGGIVVWHVGNDSSSHRDHVSNHSRLLEDCDLRYMDSIAWVKTSANYGIPRNIHIKRNGYYFPAIQWEALQVYQSPGDMPKMTQEGIKYMSDCHTNAWEVPSVTNQVKNYGHPAVVPTEMPYRCLQAYSARDDVVLDPFGGSGTTLIAAEKCSRRARLVEINPVFCDMAAKRWEKLTGGTAEWIR